MAQTIFPVSGMRSGVAIRRAAGDLEPWHPPRALWRLYLLCVLTAGLYVCRWAWELADDLKRHRDGEMRPWVFALGMPVPVLNAALLVRFTWIIGIIEHSAGKPPADQDPLRLIFVSAPLVLYPCHLIFITTFHDWNSNAAVATLLQLLLLPWSLLTLQARIDTLKSTLVNPRWTERPHPFARDEVWLLAAVLFIVPTVAIWAFEEKLDRWRGEPLAVNQAVVGSSGLYSLTPPDAGWVRVGADQFYPNSDLSLYGPSEDTHILVWVRCDGVSVEDRVRFRRGKKRGAYRDMVTDEERRLLPESLLPISFARYSGTWKGGPTTSLVATFAQGEVMVEVLGQSTGGEGERAAMERMVRSLKPREDATSCDGR